MKSAAIELLLANPFLLLMLVAGLGFMLGRLKVRGFSLGVAAVLFVGLAFGALHPEMRLPDLIYQLGLIVFVYTVGLAGGPGFFAALGRRGLRDNSLVLSAIVVAAGLAVAVSRAFGFRGTFAAGIFAGGLTNTPALAAVLDYQRDHAPAALRDAALTEPVVGYSVAYPMGVLGVILAITLAQRLFRTDYAAEEKSLEKLGVAPEEIVDVTVRVTRSDLGEATLAALVAEHGFAVVFGRHQRGAEQHVAGPETRLHPGDLLSVIGSEKQVERVVSALGERSSEPLYLNRRTLDFRRVFVSSAEVFGKSIRELSLPQRFGAIITRVRRGDVDLLARPDTILEPGDRVRVVAPAARIKQLGAFFGDSFKALSEIDVAVFAVGIAAGLLLGLIPLPLPGGLTFRLGLAGGPLIAGLCLGAIARTGPIVWHLPYNANLTLRQFGLILFLAGVGTRSGYAFVTTLERGGGMGMFAAGVIVTSITALGALVVGHKLLRIPMSLLTGIVSGLHTQPAVLAFAAEQSKNELPHVGYAGVFPVATVGKILAAQLIIALLD